MGTKPGCVNGMGTGKKSLEWEAMAMGIKILFRRTSIRRGRRLHTSTSIIRTADKITASGHHRSGRCIMEPCIIAIIYRVPWIYVSLLLPVLLRLN